MTICFVQWCHECLIYLCPTGIVLSCVTPNVLPHKYVSYGCYAADLLAKDARESKVEGPKLRSNRVSFCLVRA